MSYCKDCGTKLIDKELANEGIVPFCTTCNKYCFPQYNVAVSMVVINKENDELLLIKQYGRDFYILVAGYVNIGEQLEHAVLRELKEETGMTGVAVIFNKTKFYNPSNTLMCNFIVYVNDDKELKPNYEIDSYKWFNRFEAKSNIKDGSLAQEFLLYALEKKEAM